MYASPAPPVGQYPGQYYVPAPKKNNTCCYSVCSLVVFTIVIYAVYTSVPYLNPKNPLISIADISVYDFTISQSNLTAHTKFTIDLNITNTNTKVGFASKLFSLAKLNYKNAELCNGTVPNTRMDPISTKVVKLTLEGNGAFDDSTKAYLDADVANGKVQLDLMTVFTLATVVDGNQKQVKDVVARCKTVVDNVDPKSEIRILSSTCISHW